MNNHTSARRGQKVFLILNNDEKIFGKYIEDRSTFVILEKDNGSRMSVQKSLIRSLSIARITDEAKSPKKEITEGEGDSK